MTPDEDDLYDQDLLRDITPGVMSSLKKSRFFTRLEDVVFPNSPKPHTLCDHSFSFSSVLLAEDGHDERAQEDVFAVMRSLGGFCDCEIIWNVAPDSPAREAYWMARAQTKKLAPAGTKTPVKS